MRHSVKIFSRIGELLQGILPDGSHFLVSGLPSRHFFSEAIIEDAAVRATPADAAMPMTVDLPPKASQALYAFLAAHGKRKELSGKAIRLHSNIPPGKGLSSSSTDILSVLSVVNDHLQTGLSEAGLYALAATIEPTDPCLSDDIVLFRQHKGITDCRISLPPVSMIWFDGAPGRKVDTVGFERSYDADAAARFASLLDGFMAAAEQGDYTGLFDGITQSALYNQAILPLPDFDDYHRLAIRTGAGLMVAHSGTIIGLLTRPGEYNALLPAVVSMTAGRLLQTEHYSFNPTISLC